jgi:hypothetical protein
LEEERTRSNEGKSPEKSKGSRCQKKSWVGFSLKRFRYVGTYKGRCNLLPMPHLISMQLAERERRAGVLWNACTFQIHISALDVGASRNSSARNLHATSLPVRSAQNPNRVIEQPSMKSLIQEDRIKFRFWHHTQYHIPPLSKFSCNQYHDS